MEYNITELKENEVFVFGSNLRGRHGAGAARFAAEEFGAIESVYFGPTGKCFAIPTKDENINTMRVEDIERYVKVFITYVWQFPEKRFLLTEIGCGLAGLNHSQIAPMFKYPPPNLVLPPKFIEVIDKLNFI